MISVIFALSLIIGIFSYIVYRNIDTNYEASLNAVGEVTASSLAPALRFFDYQQANNIIRAIHKRKTVKSVIVFNIGAHAGLIYNFTFNWAARASLHIARGSGSNTTTMAMQAFLGASYMF